MAMTRTEAPRPDVRPLLLLLLVLILCAGCPTTKRYGARPVRAVQGVRVSDINSRCTWDCQHAQDQSGCFSRCTRIMEQHNATTTTKEAS